MQEKLALGRNVLEIGIEASAEASRTMIAALGPTYRPLTAGFGTSSIARMLQLQPTAFDVIRPGRTLCEFEPEVSAAFADLGVAEFQRHHTGHGIDLEGHG